MVNIGFTTGSLYRSDIHFDDRIGLYHSLGADAIELSWATPDEFLAYLLSEDAAEAINRFEHVSIHAPWKKIRYCSDSITNEVIEKSRYLCGRLPIEGLVLHPDTIDDFEGLNDSGLPFLIENMDNRKEYGITPEDFEEFKERCGFGFVLDLQHVYEHDSSMQLTYDFLDVMGDRLKHAHVSGHSESEIHVPTHLAINKDAIASVLNKIKVPIILEGVLLEDIENRIRKELEFARGF